MKNLECFLTTGLLLFSLLVYSQSSSIDLSHRCGYTPAEFTDALYFFGNDPRVEQIVDQICRAAGIPKSFKVQGANVPSVAAIRDESGDYLLYSLSFTRELLDTKPLVLYAILTHEIGHFARDHHLDGRFRLKEESSADEFVGRTLFQLSNFSSLQQVRWAMQQVPFAYEQLYKNGMRDQIISNGWNTADGLVKSNSNLGYLDNETNVEKLPLPVFTLRGCPRSYQYPLENLKGCTKVKDLDKVLVNTLQKLGYEQLSYYSAPNGFALLTPVEQIDRNAAPLTGKERWQDYPSVGSFSGIFDYLSSLVLPKKGYFRLFVFLVSDQNAQREKGKLAAEDARAWLQEGAFWLPDAIGEKPLTSDHRFSILIYEFEAPETTKKLTEKCESLFTIKAHLDNSGIGGSLK